MFSEKWPGMTKIHAEMGKEFQHQFSQRKKNRTQNYAFSQKNSTYCITNWLEKGMVFANILYL